MRRKFPGRMLPGVVVVGALIAGVAPAWAHEAAPPVEDSARVRGLIARATVSELPSPEAEVWFLRAIFAPGATAPPDQQIGPSLVAVESGRFVVTTDMPLAVIRDASSASAGVEQVTGAGEVELAAGDAALIPDLATIAAHNPGTDPASVLMLMIWAPQREAMPIESEATPVPGSVVFQPIGFGRAELPAEPGSLTIYRLVIPPECAILADERVPGVEVGAVESGELELSVLLGEVWIWRGIADGHEDTPVEREQIGAGASVTLAADDAYFVPVGTVLERGNASEAPVSLLSAWVVPADVATPTP